jgi:hypothetical protein
LNTRLKEINVSDSPIQQAFWSDPVLEEGAVSSQGENSGRPGIFEVSRLFESQRMAFTIVVVGGVIVAILEYITHSLVSNLRGSVALDAFIDAGVIALFTMVLLGIIIAAGRAWREKMNEDMRSVAELNHHVRNALAVIRDSHLLPTEVQTQAVIESVDRIDRTLRRLFPATSSSAVGAPLDASRPFRRRRTDRTGSA